MLLQGKNLSAPSQTNKINSAVNCHTNNVIYCVNCRRCSSNFIGQTSKTAADRFSQHRGYVNSFMGKKAAGKTTEATGEHFNLPGHSISDMKFQVIEKVFDKDKAIRLAREKMYINFFETEFRGMNRKS